MSSPADSSTPFAKYKTWLPLGLSAILFYLYPWWTVDDAYIAYRYGANLVNFGELNWNPGEDPVEGYTGVFLPLLSAALIQFGLPLTMGIKALCILIFFAGYSDLRRIMRRTGATETSTMVALFLFALSPLTYIHTLSGLETVFFVTAVIAVMDALLELLQEGKLFSHFRLALLLLFACLVRPEGIALAFPVLVVAFTLQFKVGKKEFTKLAGLMLCIFILPLIAGFIYRWNYYGLLLPNTFYAKSFEGWVNRESLKDLLQFSLVWLAVPAFLILSGPATGKSSEQIRFRKIFVGLSIAFALPVIAVYLHSNLWMNYSFRMWMPLYALILPPMAWALDNYIFKQQLSKEWFRNRVMMLLGVLALQGTLWGIRYYKDIDFVLYYRSIVNEEFFPVAQKIKASVGPDEWLVCFKDAGVIPFKTGLKTVDFGVLNDEFLAGKNRSMKERRDYFFSKNPGVLVMTSHRLDSLVYLEESDSIIADPRFRNYELTDRFGNSAKFPYFQFLFLRRDLVKKEKDNR